MNPPVDSRDAPAETFPRGALLAAGALIAFSLLAVGAVRLFGDHDRVFEPALAHADAVRQLQFEDQADGSLRVIDVVDGRVVATLEPGSGGFVRGAMRALARTRALHDVGAETPFLLAYGDDGRLVLEDPATASHIPLDAFGPSNVAAFAVLLHAPRG
ncbi:MAG: photosynthetic complex assembly protein PuhC [Pseudomonadales bacterium]